MSSDDSTLLQHLQEWNCENMYNFFTEEEITLDDLKLLRQDQMSELLKPFKFGVRIRFEHHFVNWRKSLGLPLKSENDETPVASGSEKSLQAHNGKTSKTSSDSVAKNSDCRPLTQDKEKSSLNSSKTSVRVSEKFNALSSEKEENYDSPKSSSSINVDTMLKNDFSRFSLNDKTEESPIPKSETTPNKCPENTSPNTSPEFRKILKPHKRLTANGDKNKSTSHTKIFDTTSPTSGCLEQNPKTQTSKTIQLNSDTLLNNYDSRTALQNKTENPIQISKSPSTSSEINVAKSNSTLKKTKSKKSSATVDYNTVYSETASSSHLDYNNFDKKSNNKENNYTSESSKYQKNQKSKNATNSYSYREENEPYVDEETIQWVSEVLRRVHNK